MRVTTKMMTDTALNNLNTNLRRLQRTQDKISSGKEVRKPSDDPVAVSRALGYRATVANQEQYIKNIDDGMSWIGTSDSALGSAGDALQRARELAIQAGGASVNQDERKKIAAEIDELASHLVQIANTTYGDQYVFGGYKSTTPPYALDATRSNAIYSGDEGLVSREMEPQSTVVVNLPGNSVFTNAFSTLIQLRNDLNANNVAAVTGTDLTGIDTAMNDILNGRSVLGARYNRLESASSRLSDVQVKVKELLSKVEDVDLPAAITDLTMQEAVYKAALAANARAIQPSLLDFLR